MHRHVQATRAALPGPSRRDTPLNQRVAHQHSMSQSSVRQAICHFQRGFMVLQRQRALGGRPSDAPSVKEAKQERTCIVQASRLGALYQSSHPTVSGGTCIAVNRLQPAAVPAAAKPTVESSKLQCCPQADHSIASMEQRATSSAPSLGLILEP
jgi:hypothetical protein